MGLYEIEKDSEGRYCIYGNRATKCIKVYMTYGKRIVERFVPVFINSKYNKIINFDFVQTDEEAKQNESFLKYMEEKWIELEPRKVGAWKRKIKNKYNGKSNKGIAISKMLETDDWVDLTQYIPNQAQGPIKDLRADGICIITITKAVPGKMQKQTLNRIVLGIDNKSFGNEQIPKKLRKRVLKYYNYIDAVTGKKENENNLIIEHKFPEVRWGDKEPDIDVNMSEEQIERKFQLFTAHYNSIKREACNRCYFESEREYPLGIKYFYDGDENWCCDYKKNAEAEEGCFGCGWYDMNAWKRGINEKLNEEGEDDDE